MIRFNLKVQQSEMVAVFLYFKTSVHVIILLNKNIENSP
jgi:hypothetical protein